MGGYTRRIWLWVRRRIYADIVAAGYDDLNPSHVLLFRYPTMEGRRPGELADEMQITKQSVNDLLGHLERHGYLVRAPDPDDRRGRVIQLTERGQVLEAATFVAAENAEREATGLIGVDRMRELRRILSDLVEKLPE